MSFGISVVLDELQLLLKCVSGFQLSRRTFFCSESVLEDFSYLGGDSSALKLSLGISVALEQFQLL